VYVFNLVVVVAAAAETTQRRFFCSKNFNGNINVF
jgi:hypothetical protein